MRADALTAHRGGPTVEEFMQLLAFTRLAVRQRGQYRIELRQLTLKVIVGRYTCWLLCGMASYVLRRVTDAPWAKVVIAAQHLWAADISHFSRLQVTNVAGL